MTRGERQGVGREYLQSANWVFISRLTTCIARVPFRFGAATVACAVFMGCVAVSASLHEPVPRIHDEFSYLLMADTFAHGHIANQTPPLPEFFDTFHVLMHPVYASKYFPGQGVFLALGEKLTGHAAVGVWLSSALACGAAVWMLQAWTSPGWALLGGILMALQYGIFSYWSQSYWGGMVAALGGGLFFGAFRRLWERFHWANAIYLAVGLLILANTRPVEGALAVLPATILLVYQVLKHGRWKEAGFVPCFALPLFLILMCGALGMVYYNYSITGSALKPPYALHEQQYQESPPFIFLPMRPKLTYTNAFIQYFYEVQENRLWALQRVPKLWMSAVASRLGTWWLFYFGYPLTIALVLPVVLLGSKLRWIQAGLIIALAILVMKSGSTDFAIGGLVSILVVAQIVALWFVFDDVWERLALCTIAAVIMEGFFVKWAWAHYSAPTAVLVMFLQVEGLRRIWNWRQSKRTPRALRGRRQKFARQKQNRTGGVPTLRWVVCLVPIACFVSLSWRLEARLLGRGGKAESPEEQALLMNDWSVRRAHLENWLEQQQSPQIVFVRYWPHHNVNFEWVYNQADIMRSHVIWARDLGGEHNSLLLNLVPDRTAWMLAADAPEPQLVPYSAVTKNPASWLWFSEGGSSAASQR